LEVIEKSLLWVATSTDRRNTFTKLYIEALFADEVLADQVCKLWDTELIPEELVAMLWLILAG
jgi:hypothetical protein